MSLLSPRSNSNWGNNNNSKNENSNNSNRNGNDRNGETAETLTTDDSEEYEDDQETLTSTTMASNVFSDSCAPISLPCKVGSSYIDPCTCRGRLECTVNTYSFIKRDCANGTAWNHLTGFCDEESKIYFGTGSPVCVRDEPWKRCSTVQNSYSQSYLERSCVTHGPPREQNSGSSDSGAIVGGVVGGMAAILLIAVIMFMWRKRGCQKKKKSAMPTLPFRQNAKEMEENEENEEVYAVIDEKGIEISTSGGIYQGKEYDNLAFEKSEKNTHQDAYANEKTTNFFTSGESPEGYHILMKGNTLNTHEDLSRSTSMDGRSILIQDSDGYQVGYPAGTVSRQPSPTPAPMEEIDLRSNDDNGKEFEYDLEKKPSSFNHASMEIGRTAF